MGCLQLFCSPHSPAEFDTIDAARHTLSLGFSNSTGTRLPPHPLQWLFHFLCWSLLLFLLPKSTSKRLRPWPYYLSLSDPLLNENNSNNILILVANTEHLLWARHYDYVIRFSQQPCVLILLLSSFYSW